MRLDVCYSARGVYFVTTNAQEPYGMGPLPDSTLLADDLQADTAQSTTAEEVENNVLFQNTTSVF
jgi:hypothetical protein